MASATAFDPNERLPWLSDPVRPQPRQARRSWIPLGVAVSLSVAIAYGGWTLVQPANPPAPRIAESAQTIPLPEPQIAPPQTTVEPQPQSTSEREALRPAAAEPIARKRESRVEPRPTAKRPAPVSAPAAAAETSAYDPRAWQSGIPGRIIQLGAFATSAKAQSEWRRVYARYPLLRPLSPRVMRSKIRGRTYHRLQLGTFSQAHSELLCQRLRATGQGCIVLGLGGIRR